MTHFVGLVIGPSIEGQLERYNENREVEPYKYTYQDGTVEMTTYNPESKWDWYTIGGVWSGFLTTKAGQQVDVCHADQIDWPATIAQQGFVPGVVVAEGVWRADATYGWFGFSDPTPGGDDWDEWFMNFVTRLGNTVITVIDFHI